MKAEHAIVTRQSSRTCCTGLSHCAYVKARLHRRFLSRQLNAIFVALKLQLKNRTCKPAAISEATIRQTSNSLFFSYGPTSLEGKRTHNCGMDEKRVWVETHPVSFLSRPNVAALAPTPRIERSREKRTASSLHETR